ALAAGLDGDGFELLVQGQLFRQPVAQLGLVVDNQDFARIGHSVRPPPILAPALPRLQARSRRGTIQEPSHLGNRRSGQEPDKKRTMKPTALRAIRVSTRPGRKSQGWMFAGPLAAPVALGRTGIKADKRERE